MYTKFGTVVGVADLITCDKFFGDRLRGVDSVGDQILSFPIDQSPLTLGWHYRAAREKCRFIRTCKARIITGCAV